MSSLDVDVVHPFSISHTFCVTFGGLVVNVCVLCNVCLRIFMTSARVECWRPVTERVGHFCTNINNILFVKDVARRHIKNGNGKMKNSYLTLSLFRIYSLSCWHEMPAAHPHAQTATTIRHSWPEWVSVWLEFLRVHARDWASCGASHALFRHAFCTDVHHHVRIGSCSSCLAITRSARHVKMLRFSFVRPNGISCGPFRAPSLHEAQSNVLCELSRYSSLPPLLCTKWTPSTYEECVTCCGCGCDAECITFPPWWSVSRKCKTRDTREFSEVNVKYFHAGISSFASFGSCISYIRAFRADKYIVH